MSSPSQPNDSDESTELPDPPAPIIGVDEPKEGPPATEVDSNAGADVLATGGTDDDASASLHEPAHAEATPDAVASTDDDAGESPQEPAHAEATPDAVADTDDDASASPPETAHAEATPNAVANMDDDASATGAVPDEHVASRTEREAEEPHDPGVFPTHGMDHPQSVADGGAEPVDLVADNQTADALTPESADGAPEQTGDEGIPPQDAPAADGPAEPASEHSDSTESLADDALAPPSVPDDGMVRRAEVMGSEPPVTDPPPWVGSSDATEFAMQAPAGLHELSPESALNAPLLDALEAAPLDSVGVAEQQQGADREPADLTPLSAVAAEPYGPYSVHSVTPALEALVGTTVGGRYRVERLVGEGGVGAVYEATHIHLRKAVALKVLRPEMGWRGEVVARFEREAVAASRVEHPNVAGATDFGTLDDGAYFLVMELVRGRSLRDEIANGPLPFDRATKILRQVSRAVVRAHSVGVVHRDIKPENVMLIDRDGDPDFVKVLDFGVAKIMADELSNAMGGPLTKAGTIYGTPEYMAPEQALGNAADARADLYSLGVLAFELYTGRRPYVAATHPEQLSLQLTQPPPSMASVFPGVEVPAGAETAIRRLLESDTGRRIQTAEEFLDELDRGLAPPLVIVPQYEMDPDWAHLAVSIPPSAAPPANGDVAPVNVPAAGPLGRDLFHSAGMSSPGSEKPRPLPSHEADPFAAPGNPQQASPFPLDPPVSSDPFAPNAGSDPGAEEAAPSSMSIFGPADEQGGSDHGGSSPDDAHGAPKEASHEAAPATTAAEPKAPATTRFVEFANNLFDLNAKNVAFLVAIAVFLFLASSGLSIFLAMRQGTFLYKGPTQHSPTGKAKKGKPQGSASAKGPAPAPPEAHH